MNIVNGEGTTLKEFKITGISSPEGRYASNLDLARRRTAYALQQITSVIPPEKWKRVFKHPNETRVATWDEVADLLEQDSLKAEAADIRAITQKYKNPDAQFAAVSRLPYYATVIKERLPKLRTVQYEYKHEIFRELNPDEILERYKNDPDYRDGKKSFTRYEYWHLFQMVKDPKEAEKIFRRAYRETMAYDLKGQEKPWILARQQSCRGASAARHFRRGCTETADRHHPQSEHDRYFQRRYQCDKDRSKPRNNRRQPIGNVHTCLQL